MDQRVEANREVGSDLDVGEGASEEFAFGPGQRGQADRLRGLVDPHIARHRQASPRLAVATADIEDRSWRDSTENRATGARARRGTAHHGSRSRFEPGMGEVPPPPERRCREVLLPLHADGLVHPFDLLVDRRKSRYANPPSSVDLLVVVDHRRSWRVGRNPREIVDRSVPSDVERIRRDAFRSQGQDHCHLIKVEGPVAEQFAPLEKPSGPRLPGGRQNGQDGRGDQRKIRRCCSRQTSRHGHPTGVA